MVRDVSRLCSNDLVLVVRAIDMREASKQRMKKKGRISFEDDVYLNLCDFYVALEVCKYFVPEHP